MTGVISDKPVYVFFMGFCWWYNYIAEYMSLYAWGWGLTNQASALTPVILDKNQNKRKEGNIPILIINV
jgi:hypothetical protein